MSDVSSSRPAMKLVVKELRENGFDVKILKKDDGEILRKKAVEAIMSIVTPAVQKTLESIDPSKLWPLLNRDCEGLYVDLRTQSCASCPDAAQCVRAFIKNVKDEFKAYEKVIAPVEDKKAEKPPAPAAKTLPAADGKKPPGPNRARTNFKMAPPFDAERLVFVMDVPNPAKSGDPAYATQQAILDEVPSTLGDLRKIVCREWKYLQGDDERFMRDWVEDLRELGVLKLDEDLSKADKKFYRSHGFNV